MPAAGAWDLHLDGHRSDEQRARIKAIGFIVELVVQIGATFSVSQTGQQHAQKFTEAKIT